MFKYVWPKVKFIFIIINVSDLLIMLLLSSKDNPEIRKRVMMAMGLLVSAKLLNVGVPFLFKFAVDHLNAHLDSPLTMADPQSTAMSVTVALLIGCKFSLFQHQKLICSEFLIRSIYF